MRPGGRATSNSATAAILRQGNLNSEIDIYRYVTEGSFDAYSGRRSKPRPGSFSR